MEADAKVVLSWWYDDATMHADRSTLLLAGLIAYDDGTSAVAHDGFFRRFPTLDDANCWLIDLETQIVCRPGFRLDESCFT